MSVVRSGWVGRPLAIVTRTAPARATSAHVARRHRPQTTQRSPSGHSRDHGCLNIRHTNIAAPVRRREKSPRRKRSYASLGLGYRVNLP
jgi:hypothetical protein